VAELFSGVDYNLGTVTIRRYSDAPAGQYSYGDGNKFEIAFDGSSTTSMFGWSWSIIRISSLAD